MPETLIEFTVPGSPRDVSRAIEGFATGQGNLTAVIVPWRSDPDNVDMAITATQGEGRYLQHTDVGTLRVTKAGDDTTRIAIVPHEFDPAADKQQLAVLLVRLRNQIQSHFKVAP